MDNYNELNKHSSDAKKNKYSFSPDDVVAGIFAFSGLNEFTSNKKALHNIFSTLKMESKANHAEIFRDFVFSRGDIYPFSKELESILIGLQISGIIEAKNPKYLTYLIDEKGKQYVEMELLEDFDDKQKEYLKKLGSRFHELLSVTNE